MAHKFYGAKHWTDIFILPDSYGRFGMQSEKFIPILKINLNASRFGQKLATPNKVDLTKLWQETDLFYEIGWAGPTDAEK